MFFKRKTSKDGERAEAVVLGADMSGYSNSHGINKWHLHLRVKYDDGTMADPKCLDPTIDPNERAPGTSFLGDPRIVNDGPIGLARFSTLRSWLSQWSVDDSKADGIVAATERRGLLAEAIAHGLGDGAKSPHGLDCATKMVRRDCAGLSQSLGESSERFLVEARHRRTAELVIDQQPDRVRADVDDRVGASIDPLGALDVEPKRPQRLFRRVNACLRHRVFSASSLSQANGDGPPTVPCPLPLRRRPGRLSGPSAAPPGRA